jgi:hypothetical protein
MSFEQIPRMKWRSERISIMGALFLRWSCLLTCLCAPYLGRRQWRGHVRHSEDTSLMDGGAVSGWSFSSLWWENGRVFLASREEDLEDALQRFRLQRITNMPCILVRGDRDEGEPPSRQSILIVSKKCVCTTTAKDNNYAIVPIPITRPRDLCLRFWLHDLS